MFQSERQLDVPTRFQLGAKMDPCVVEFGAHAYDADKPYRAIKIRCRETEMDLFKAYDDSMFNSQPVLKEWNDIVYVTLKVKADDPNIPLLTRDRRFLAIVYAKKWKMDGKNGVSLYAEAIKIVDLPVQTYTFIEVV
jgi:hypothetical protein